MSDRLGGVAWACVLVLGAAAVFEALVALESVRIGDPRDGSPAGMCGTRANLVAMAPNIIGLGLIVAGVIFLIIGGIVLWILGAICLIGGVGAMWMTWQRKRRAAA